MKLEQAFVRAINKDGKRDAVDVLKLDDESFRAFVIEILCRAGLVVHIIDAFVESERIILRERKGNE